MILLDTNVLSELMRREPDASVERWLADQPITNGRVMCRVIETLETFGFLAGKALVHRSVRVCYCVYAPSFEFSERFNFNRAV